MADVSERPPFVAWAARALERDPADVLDWADTDHEVVLVFRQGDKRRVPHAQAEARRDDLPPAEDVAAETTAPDDSDLAPETAPSVAAETADPIEPDPAAELDLPAVTVPVDEPEPAAKPKTSRRGGR